MKEIVISSSVLIVLILLVRAIFREHIPRRMMYSLWLLVAVRLLFPIQIGVSDYSVLSISQTASEFPVVQAFTQQIEATTDNMIIPVLNADLVVKPNDITETTPAIISQESTITTNQTVDSVESTLESKTHKSIHVSDILKSFWIIGVISFAFWFLSTNLSFRRKLKAGSSFISCAESPIPVRVSPNAISPCLIGIVHPTIYLPVQYSKEDQIRSHILAHELTHVKQRDNLWAFIRCVCLCIYWFHPLVWVASLASQQDCELACDEGAVKMLNDSQRLSYGRTLLDMAVQQTIPRGLFFSNTAMFGSNKTITERVNALVKREKITVSAVFAVVAIAAISVFITFTGGKKGIPNSSLVQTAATSVSVKTESVDSSPVFTFNPVQVGESQQTRSLVLDADGNDVTGEIVELWGKYQAAINVYDQYDGTIFHKTGDTLYSPVDLPAGKYEKLENYDDTVRSIFSSEALARYEEKMFPFPLYQDPNTGSVYQYADFTFGGRYIHVDTRVLSTSNNTLELLTGSYFSQYGIGPLLDYHLYHWSAIKEEGIWKISDMQEEVTAADYAHVFLEVKDGAGNDITEELANLWVACCNAYSSGGDSVFDITFISLNENSKYTFQYLQNYDAVIAGIFTEHGQQQLETALFGNGRDVIRPFLRYKGKALRLLDYGTLTKGHPTEYYAFSDPVYVTRAAYEMNGAASLTEMEVISSSEDSLTLRVTYREFNADGSMFTPYTVLWTVKKENGRWLVDDFTHPGSFDSPPTKTLDGIRLSAENIQFSR